MTAKTSQAASAMPKAPQASQDMPSDDSNDTSIKREPLALPKEGSGEYATLFGTCSMTTAPASIEPSSTMNVGISGVATSTLRSSLVSTTGYQHGPAPLSGKTHNPWKHVLQSFKLGQFTDLSLKSVDGKLIRRVHKCVVCPQSQAWSKIMEKTPKKAEIITKYQPAILNATINWCYTGGYNFSGNFASQWSHGKMSDDQREVEFHFRMFQAAVELGIEELQSLAVRCLKNRLLHESDTNQLAVWLQETSGKKDAEPPMAIVDVVIEMQARNVRYYMTSKGMSLNEAFHQACEPVRSLYLIDFIYAVSEALGMRLHNYLRCPNCSCTIRSKHAGSNRVMCTRNDCHADNRLGEVVIKQD